jgi:hypothetical protein
MKSISFFLTFFYCQTSSGQDTNPFIPEGDAKYFEFWSGTWLEIKEDGSLDSLSRFKITRSVNASSFIEEWQFSNGAKSVAVRAWDKINKKWGFVWISENGLYQVWDTRKIDGNWYIFKHFTIGADSYLSRQGFIPQSDGTVLRISEKSYDEKTWELRFKQQLRKISN